MKKLTWTVVIIFLLLAGPVTAQYYIYFDQDAYMRFSDDSNKPPVERRGNIREYRELGTATASSYSEGMTEIEEPQWANSATSEGQMFDLVATAADGTVSMKEFRTQIEKMKGQVEAEYLELVNEKVALGKEGDSSKSQKDLVSYNKSVDAFNQRAENYEKKSIKLSKLVDEYNAFLCFSMR